MSYDFLSVLGSRTLIALAAISFVSGALAAEDPSCVVDRSYFSSMPKFPKMLDSLEKGEAIKILVIGGASSLGRAAGDPDNSWPSRLNFYLAKQYPNAVVSVINKSVPRNSVQAFVTHFDSDVASVKPNLVIWETGVTDAVRGTNIEEFRKALQKGLTKLKAVVPETMLMDIQYSRATSLVTSSTSYMTMLHGVAALNQTAVFPRNEIMRNWEESNTFNYNINGQSERRVLATRLYDCLGQAVANAIVRKSPLRSDK